MIWDCFMFAGELDMLECRLATLERYDVHHVISEANVDNHGRPKPIVLKDNLDRFAKWRSRFTYIIPGALEGTEPWDREHEVRDTAMNILKPNATWSDTVLVADVDEIPSTLPFREGITQPHTLLMRDIAISLDRAWEERQPTSVVTPYPFTTIDGLSGVRKNRHLYPVISPGGWHLSWLGGPEAVEKKLAMHCHSRRELDERISKLQPNDDIPAWCREHAPASWWVREEVT